MDKITNSSSANAQANGWTFQYVAALIIYLENISQAKCFCVEGSEDIVVYLKSENIYAQAKSSLNQTNIVSLHFDEIIDSIRTLSKMENAKELISVFNFRKPFGNDDSFLVKPLLNLKVLTN